MALSATAPPLTENKAALPQQCTQLFKETENLTAQAEKQPGTHTQVGKIKSKLNQQTANSRDGISDSTKVAVMWVYKIK